MRDTKRTLADVAAYFDEVFELDAPFKRHPLSPYAAAVSEAATLLNRCESMLTDCCPHAPRRGHCNMCDLIGDLWKLRGECQNA